MRTYPRRSPHDADAKTIGKELGSHMNASTSIGTEHFLSHDEKLAEERFGWSNPQASVEPLPDASSGTPNMFVHPPTVADLIKIKGKSMITIEPDALVSRAANLMSSLRIGLLLVGNEADTIVGVLSERDLVKAVAEVHNRPLERMTVRELMITNVITCDPADTLLKVLDEMRTRKFRHMPVAENRKITAMLSITDVLTHLKEHVAIYDEEYLWMRLMTAF
jgi:CBS domain-containing protein